MLASERPPHRGRTSRGPQVRSPKLARNHADVSQSFAQIIELQDEFISLAKMDGELMYVNAAYARLHGTQPKDMVGRNLFDFVPHEHREFLRHHFDETFHSSRPSRIKNQVALPDGRRIWVLWTNIAFTDQNGTNTIHSTGRDIQREVEVEAKLQESEARYRLLADASTDVVMALDRNLIRTYVSPSSLEMFGYAPHELVGSKTGESAHPDDVRRLNKGLRALLDGQTEKFVGLNRRRHRDGQWIWAETHYRAIQTPEGGAISGIVATVRDVTVRKAVEDKLADAYKRLAILAKQDALTGLANRRAFDEAMSKESRRASRGDEFLCLIMIDVDRFKAFNDHYGHPAGDDCLRKIATAIKGCMRRATDLAVRYGGEEFAVMLPGVDETGGQIVAERIRQAVRQLNIAHEYSEHRVVTVSVGVTSVSRAEFLRSRNSLLDRADAALYLAKQNGRDRVETDCALTVIRKA